LGAALLLTVIARARHLGDQEILEIKRFAGARALRSSWPMQMSGLVFLRKREDPKPALKISGENRRRFIFQGYLFSTLPSTSS
jgi:hypothetical protein